MSHMSGYPSRMQQVRYTRQSPNPVPSHNMAQVHESGFEEVHWRNDRDQHHQHEETFSEDSCGATWSMSTSCLSCRTFKLREETQCKEKKVMAPQPAPNPPGTNFCAPYASSKAAPLPPLSRGASQMCMWYPNAWAYQQYLPHVGNPYHLQPNSLPHRTYPPQMYHPSHVIPRSESQSPPPRGVPQESYLGAMPNNGPICSHPPHGHQPAGVGFGYRPHIPSSSHPSMPRPSAIPNPQPMMGFPQNAHTPMKHLLQPLHGGPHIPLNAYYAYMPPPNMDQVYPHGMTQFQSQMFASAHFAGYQQYTYRPMAAHVSRAKSRPKHVKRESVGTSKTPTRSGSKHALHGTQTKQTSASPQEIRKRASKETEHARRDFSSTAAKSAAHVTGTAPVLQLEVSTVQPARSYSVLPRGVSPQTLPLQPGPPTTEDSPPPRPTPTLSSNLIPTLPPQTKQWSKSLRRRAESMPRAGHNCARKLHTEDTPLPQPKDADYLKMWEEELMSEGKIRAREETPQKRGSESKLHCAPLGEKLRRSVRSSAPHLHARVLGDPPEKPFCQDEVPPYPVPTLQSLQKCLPRDRTGVSQLPFTAASQFTPKYGTSTNLSTQQELSSGAEIPSTDTSSPYPSSLSEMPECLKPWKSRGNEAGWSASRARSLHRHYAGGGHGKSQQQQRSSHSSGRTRAASVSGPPLATSSAISTQTSSQRRARRCAPADDEATSTEPPAAADRLLSASRARSGHCSAPSRRKRLRLTLEVSPSPSPCALLHPATTPGPTHPRPATATFATWSQYKRQHGHYSQMQAPYEVPSETTFNVSHEVEKAKYPKRPKSQQMQSQPHHSPVHNSVEMEPQLPGRQSDTRVKINQLLISSLPTLEEVASSTSKATASQKDTTTVSPEKSKTTLRQDSLSKGNLSQCSSERAGARASSLPPSTPTTPTALSRPSTPPTPMSHEASFTTTTMSTPSTVSARTLTTPTTPTTRISRDRSVKSYGGQGGNTTLPCSENGLKLKTESEDVTSISNKVLVPVVLRPLAKIPRKLQAMQRVTVKIVRDEKIVSSVSVPLKTLSKGNSGTLADDTEDSNEKKGFCKEKESKKKYFNTAGQPHEKNVFTVSSSAGDGIMNDIAALKGLTKTVHRTWETCYVVEETDGEFSSGVEATPRGLPAASDGSRRASHASTEPNASGEGTSTRPSRASRAIRPPTREPPNSPKGGPGKKDVSIKSTDGNETSSKTEASTKHCDKEGMNKEKHKKGIVSKGKGDEEESGDNCTESKKQLSSKGGAGKMRLKKRKRKNGVGGEIQSLSTDTQLTEMSPQQDDSQTITWSVDSKTSLKSKRPSSQHRRRRKHRRHPLHRRRILACYCQMVPDNVYLRQKCWCRKRVYMNKTVDRWNPVGMYFLKLINPAEEPIRRWSSPPALSPVTPTPSPEPPEPPTTPPSKETEITPAPAAPEKEKYSWTWVCPPNKTFRKVSRSRRRVEETLPSCLKITSLSYQTDEYMSVDEPFFDNPYRKRNKKSKRPLFGRMKWCVM